MAGLGERHGILLAIRRMRYRHTYLGGIGDRRRLQCISFGAGGLFCGVLLREVVSYDYLLACLGTCLWDSLHDNQMRMMERDSWSKKGLMTWMLRPVGLNMIKQLQQLGG